MLRIIKSDIYRIYKGKLCYISAVILFVIGLILAYLAKDSSVDEMMVGVGYTGGMFIPILLTNIFVTAWGHEFSNRTVNNSLIVGISRSKFFFSKVMLTFMMAITGIIIYVLGAMIGVGIFGTGLNLVLLAKVILMQLPLYLAASALGIFLFNLGSATYMSISTFLALFFIGDSIIELIIGVYLPDLSFVLDYLFLSNISNMAYFQDLTTSLLLTHIISAIVWTIVLVMGAYSFFRRREFK